jgi:hypothetical protein
MRIAAQDHRQVKTVNERGIPERYSVEIAGIYSSKEHMRNLGIVALVVALAGCASSAADITPSYISPVQYSSYNCQQLGLEAQSVSARAAALSGAQDSQRTKDTLVTTAAVVVFWPAAFFVGGDKQTASELAQMKGQMVAIEQASISKKCNIQFQGKPPGA